MISGLVRLLWFFCVAAIAQPAVAAERIPVFVSIAPQKAFVQQIGKDRVDVQVMVQPGASPHTYEPKPRQMAAMAEAKLYFAIGVAFENAWLPRIAAANPNMKVVHMDRGIEKIPMADHHHHEDDRDHHSESTADPHEADAMDPHIWLSPPLVKQLSRTILQALVSADPPHRSAYEANYRRFIASVDALDSDLKAIFAGKQGQQFMVFHPAWGYFAHAYGLEQLPVEVEGKNPKPAQLKELIDHAKKEGIRVIFVQPQFSTRSAALVAREIGGEVVFADPLSEDWEANLRAVADRFKAALK